jgi:arylsulfatase A-like enzyme
VLASSCSPHETANGHPTHASFTQEPILQPPSATDSKPKTPKVSEAPNFLNIVLDDMNDFSCSDLSAYLPKTSSWLEQHQAGTCFDNTQSSAPQCSPSRGSLMTGEYPHNDRLMTQTGAANLDVRHTLQHELGQHGYSTYGIGKYLNKAPSKQINMHPGRSGFDQATFWDAYRYTDFPVFDRQGHKKIVHENSSPYLGKIMRDDIRQADSNKKPWYVYAGFRAPHNPMDGTPVPHPTKEHLNSPVPPLRFHPEHDLSDKLPLFTKRQLDINGPYLHIQNMRREQTLLDVDTELAKTLHMLGRLGLLKNTVVSIISDNGWENGNHDWLSKDDPYGGAVKVPMLWIANNYLKTGVDRHQASNVDIAPTELKIAGIRPNHRMDGHSLLKKNNPRKLQYSEFFHDDSSDIQRESGSYTAQIPTWSRIGNEHWSYIVYYGPDGQPIRREYYKTPLELNNSFDTLSPERKYRLALRIRDLRTCAGTVRAGSENPCT